MLIFFVGVVVSPVMISGTTIIHESIDEKMRGRIFSYIGITMNMGLLLFMFIASTLAEFIDRMWILVATGVLFSVCGLIGLGLNREKQA